MTECNLNGYAGIVAEVNVLLYIVAGCNEVCEFIAPSCAAVHGYVYTDGLCSVCGILTCHVEGELAATYKCGGDQPVIGSESTNIVDVGLRVHYAEAFVNGETCIECPLPVVAVAVMVFPGPAFCCGIALEVPAGGLAGSGSLGSGGLGSGSLIGVVGSDGYIGCIILAEEIYDEVIGVTCFEYIIVCTAAYITLFGSDPDTVAGCGVSNTPVVGACGNLDGNTVVDNNVAGIEVTVSIYGDGVAKALVETCGSVSAAGERTFSGDLVAIEGVGGVKQHLVAGAIAPNIANLKNNGSGAAGSASLGSGSLGSGSLGNRGLIRCAFNGDSTIGNGELDGSCGILAKCHVCKLCNNELYGVNTFCTFKNGEMDVYNSDGVIACGSRICSASHTDTYGTGNRCMINNDQCALCAGE